MSWRWEVKAEGTAAGKQRLSSEKAKTCPGGESGITMMMVYGMSATASAAVRLMVRMSELLRRPPCSTRASRQTDSTTSPAKMRSPRQQNRSAVSACRTAWDTTLRAGQVPEVTFGIDRSAASAPTCSSRASSSAACEAGGGADPGMDTPASPPPRARPPVGAPTRAAETGTAAAWTWDCASAAAAASFSARWPMAHQRSTQRSSWSTRTGGVGRSRPAPRVAALSSSRARVWDAIASVRLSSRARACALSSRRGPSASLERVESIDENSSKSRLPSLFTSATPKRSSSVPRSFSCGTGVSSVARSRNSSRLIRPLPSESSNANISRTRSELLVSPPSASTISSSASSLPIRA
mmetsp:Transcript_24115/g.77824  ORF Transcript_24115/g.77824 Transcript_24115/m.77824 type:complete len:353 (-) Transcript_24115:425-1483(-)